MKRRTLGLLAILLAAGTATEAVQAQTYPTRPIRLIVAYGPGSGADIVARFLADKLSEQMKTSVVVENRDGAGGAIGTAAAAKAAPDGYTLLMAPTTLTVSPSLMANPTYDPVKDFAAVTRVAVQPMVAVTRPDAPYKNFKELIDYAKANPGKVMYGTSGKGAPSHLEVELLRQRYGIEVQDVPYKSFGQAITDTMNGLVGFYFPTLPAALPHITSGKVRSLAVGSVERSPQAPQLPTIAEELGLPGYEVSVWYGIVVPAGVPQDIVAKLDSEISTALKSPELRQKIEKTGAIISPAGPDAFGKQIRSETAKWGKLVQDLGLKGMN